MTRSLIVLFLLLGLTQCADVPYPEPKTSQQCQMNQHSSAADGDPVDPKMDQWLCN